MNRKHLNDPADDPPVDTDPQGTAGAADESPLAALQRDRDELYDRLLRTTAEFDNYRKRVDRERRGQADQGIADILSDLIEVADDFELALGAGVDVAGDNAAGYKKGLELIHAKLQDLLRRRGVRAIVALGADFDPNVHQAVMHEASPGHREGEVIGEMRRGYMLGERLLRPAMVKVAKA